MVALLGCCFTISRGSALCCGLQTAPGSPVGGLYPWPEWRVVLTVLECQQVTHILKHFIANCQKYSDMTQNIKTGTQNIPCTIHLPAAPPNNNFSPFASHLPMSTPDQPILPLSTSSQPPLPRKKPSTLFSPLWMQIVGHQWTSPDIFASLIN